MIRLKYLSIVFLLCNCYVGDEVAPDQEIWEYARPQVAGLSENALIDINTRIQLNEFLEVNGLIIIKNDRLVFENYFEREESQGDIRRIPTLTQRQSTQNIGGAGLTFALAAIGVAEDKRLLAIEDPIADYLPEYEAIFLEDPAKQNITIEHLILHKSGFSWNTSIEPLSLQNDLNEM